MTTETRPYTTDDRQPSLSRPVGGRRNPSIWHLNRMIVSTSSDQCDLHERKHNQGDVERGVGHHRRLEAASPVEPPK